MIGSGSFSKVYKCMKKMDGWVYAVKKSKRHFRGKADTCVDTICCFLHQIQYLTRCSMIATVSERCGRYRR